MRKALIWFLTFIGGAYFLFEFLLPAQNNPLSGRTLEVATDLVIILSAMAFLLGPINLVRISFVNIWKRRKEWFGSIVFLVFFVLGMTAQIGNDMAQSQAAAEPAAATPGAVDPSPEGEPVVAPEPAAKPFAIEFFEVLFFGLIMAFGAASIALLAMYLVSAAFRSFRFQNVDSAVMMISATIVLIGLIPLADLITAQLPEFLRPNTWAQWILKVPNTAVQRAVAMGVTAGAFAVGTRLWLGMGTRTE